MFESSVESVAAASRTKLDYLQADPLGYFVLAVLAGVYVGFGIVLIFAVGAPLAAAGSPFLKLVMGVSFGIALSLVVFAGAELFTGTNMVMAVGALRRTVAVRGVAAVWGLSLAGNLAGGLGLAWLVAQSGVLAADPQLGFVERAAATKMQLGTSELFVRGLLCNWLVCLAVWSALRATSEAGRLIMIFWCLFAFIGAGFEHSVANVTLLGVALFQEHSAAVSWGGFVQNLAPVTAGNIVGGALFVGGAYWVTVSRALRPRVLSPRAVRASLPAEVVGEP